MTPNFSSPGTYFSECRKHRFTLWRNWSKKPAAEAMFAQFVCLNPSKADETIDDATVIKCVKLSMRWGFEALAMTNVFSLRSTDPEALYRAAKTEEGPCGEGNLEWILAVAKRAGVIVASWGNHGDLLGYGQHVSDCLAREVPDRLSVLCSSLGVPLINKTDHPVHPLYQKDNSSFRAWKGRTG